MKHKWSWLALFLGTFLGLTLLVMGMVAYIDPYFHYGRPKTDQFYYTLEMDDARKLAEGIVCNLEYDNLIVGTSMAEKFLPSQAEALFGGTFAKATVPSALYREQTELLEEALSRNPNISTVIRSMDMYNFYEDRERLEENRAGYPAYIHTDNPLDDLYYLLGRDVIFDKCIPMLAQSLAGKEPGITDFDDYTWGMGTWVCGRETVLQGRESYAWAQEQPEMPDWERREVTQNIQNQIIDLARRYPDTQFYCFFPPYSAAWWAERGEDADFIRHIQRERLVIELLLPYENIHLFSWNQMVEITGDLNNYFDSIHYGNWVNSWILEQMAAGEGRLTKENYESYLTQVRQAYENFDYAALFTQQDLEGNRIPAYFRK